MAIFVQFGPKCLLPLLEKKNKICENGICIIVFHFQVNRSSTCFEFDSPGPEICSELSTLPNHGDMCLTNSAVTKVLQLVKRSYMDSVVKAWMYNRCGALYYPNKNK